MKTDFGKFKGNMNVPLKKAKGKDPKDVSEDMYKRLNKKK